MNPSFYTWGLPVGRLFGINIKLHWMLLLFWAFRLDRVLGAADRGAEMASWLIFVALSFLIILLHEFGHCFAARSVGGSAHEVVLWPLGGLALVSAPETPRAQLITTAGGPLVNALIAAVAYPVYFYLEWNHLDWLRAHYYVYSALIVLTRFNLFLLIFNSIPLYPLDGGRIFHSALWAFYDRRGGFGMGPYYHASIVTVWTSRITAALAAMYALYDKWIFLLFIIGWAWMDTENLYRRIRSGIGPVTNYGHDFSRGYTSLEKGDRVVRKTERKPGFFERRKQKQRERAETLTREEEAKLDDLLAKISREGMSSISSSERKFLDKMSRRKSQDTSR